MSHRQSHLHEKIADWTRCSCCVTEQRLGYASAYFNFNDCLFAVCKRHATKWLVTGRALLHPAIPDISGYSDFFEAFDHIEPVVAQNQATSSTPALSSADLRTTNRPSAARQRAQARGKRFSGAAGRPSKHAPVRASLRASDPTKARVLIDSTIG
jgi:hypothetical protein